MKFKVLDQACEPYKKYKRDGGYDIRSAENVTVEPWKIKTLRTGVCVQIPDGYVGEIKPRSSSTANGIIIPDGTVDPGFTGEVFVTLLNANNEPLHIEKGDRIAQLVVVNVLIEDIEIVEELEESERGSNGLGHTGKR